MKNDVCLPRGDEAMFCLNDNDQNLRKYGGYNTRLWNNVETRQALN